MCPIICNFFAKRIDDPTIAYYLSGMFQKAINKLEYANVEVELKHLDIPKPVTREKVLEKIERIGIENVRFIAPFKRTGTSTPLGLMIGSNDEDVPTLSKITEERHKVKDHYKISLTPDEYPWYTEHYYLLDFVSLMEKELLSLLREMKL